MYKIGAYYMFMTDYSCIKDVLIYLQEHLHYEKSGKHSEINWLTIITDNELNENYPQETIKYTIEKMIEGNLVRVSKFKRDAHNTIIMCFIDDITITGHNFVDNARNDTVWNHFKNKLSKVGKVSLPIALEYLTQEAIKVFCK